MPSLVRKLVIYATVDGLVLQPVSSRAYRTIPSLQIYYSSHRITSLGFTAPEDVSIASLESYGLVGLLNIASVCYLISISHREQVAQIQGAPVYRITGVSLVPLSSQVDAAKAISHTLESLQSESDKQIDLPADDSDTSDENDELAEHDATWKCGDFDLPPSKQSTVISSRTPQVKPEVTRTVAKDVIGRKGHYGRFAERWFSQKGWSTESRKVLGLSTDDDGRIRSSDMPVTKAKETPNPSPAAERKSRDQTAQTGDDEESLEKSSDVQEARAPTRGEVVNTLLPKLLRTTKLLLASGSFFFSYDCDITRRLGSYEGGKSGMPLHCSVDPLYFWNRHLAKPFIGVGYHAFVLPLMQGFVGQQTFAVGLEATDDSMEGLPLKEKDDVSYVIEESRNKEHEESFLMTLISRRSVKRSGLRYLRRGIDEEGHTANAVETEQIMSSVSWTTLSKVHSFTQVRGSIPLFFSQSPYSFKPVPVLQLSYETNHSALRLHFKDLAVRYGRAQVVSLVNKTGGEASIGGQYEKHMHQLEEETGISGQKIGFEWFDFHEKCRGFNFTNVSLLMDSLGGVLEDFGFAIKADDVIQRRQVGVIRTNCMDCLDRTNVVQSAFGQLALQKQLKDEGIEVNLQTDPSTRWLNTLWADNGDAISKIYSSTAALKGDYTRTRKRDYRGAIKDFGLTLSRYFHNIVNDYFSQAATDYLLGNVTSQVFEDFEANMMSGDPAMSLRKVRINAINTSSQIVIVDSSEDLLGGWVLMAPQQENTIRTFPFREIVLLLTNSAIYTVRFDWNVEMVSSFERIDLPSITRVMRGTYITSTLASGQMEEDRNVGLVIEYRSGKKNITRSNTRSLDTAAGKPGNSKETAKQQSGEPSSSPTKSSLDGALALLSGRNTASSLKILAFKSLPARSSSTGVADEPGPLGASETATVRSICDAIEQAALALRKCGGAAAAAEDDMWDAARFVQERDIISLAEAKRSTGLLEQWSYSLKKLVWA